MILSTVTSKGQTTIPKVVREHLGLHTGSRIAFILQENGEVKLMLADVDIAELKGSLPKPKRPVSLEDMERAIKRRKQ